MDAFNAPDTFDVMFAPRDGDVLDSFDFDSFLDQSSWRDQVFGRDDWSSGRNEQDTSLTLAPDTENKRQQSEISHRDSESKPCSCELCGDKFTTRSTLLRHIRVSRRHRRDEDSSISYDCPLCTRKFYRKDNLERHRAEQHAKIERVECMRCGQRIKDRSLDVHLRSHRCMSHRYDTKFEPDATPTSPDARTRMLAAILQQTEEDCELFKLLSASNLCDPLYVSTYLRHIASKGVELFGNSDGLQLVPKEVQIEVYRLRGLTIRFIVRSLASGPIDDALHGAIRTFASTESMLFPEAPKIDSAVTKWLGIERSHRLQEVLSSAKYALDHWNFVSTGARTLTMLKNDEETRDLSFMQIPRTRRLLEFRNPMKTGLCVRRTPSRRSSTPMSSEISIVIDRSMRSPSNGGPKLPNPSNKRKRNANDDSNGRSVKRKMCPVSNCGRNVQQKSLGRHLRTVHKQGEVYECDHDDCDEIFLRKDSLVRHRDEKHGESAKKVECGQCGKHVCRRAMEEHSKRPACAKKAAIDNRAVLDVT